MDDHVLVLNAGSSSLKFCVYGRKETGGSAATRSGPGAGAWRIEVRGMIEGLGTEPRWAARGSGVGLGEGVVDPAVRDASGAVELLLSRLRDRFEGARIMAVGHRVVHGGAAYAGPVVVDPDVTEALGKLVPLAPLHQPHNLAAIEAARALLPKTPQVACFDTAFHRGRPAVTEVVPLPAGVRGDEVRRYGFHGLSYEFIASELPRVAPEIAQGRVLVAHLGSGASLCALRGGRSVDTTMAFTPLDGLCMGTRPGSLDPGVILHLLRRRGMSPESVEDLLYHRAGLQGIAGRSDMRELLAAEDDAARLAVDYFVYLAAKEIGALAAVLRGVDGLVFTAGIGENSPEIRRRICEASAWLGVELDSEANTTHGTRITRTGSAASAWVIPTDEEVMILRHTAALLGLGKESEPA